MVSADTALHTMGSGALLRLPSSLVEVTSSFNSTLPFLDVGFGGLLDLRVPVLLRPSATSPSLAELIGGSLLRLLCPSLAVFSERTLAGA